MAARVSLIQPPDYQHVSKKILSELLRASQNQPSSISFLKNHFPEKPLLTDGIVQGIVIGGTNYLLSTEEVKTGRSRKILKRETGILPLFDTKQTFVSFLSKLLDEHADAIGVNFGFPLQTTTGTAGELDGILIKGTKEHAFTGLKEQLGTLIKTILAKKSQKKTLISVANDTICLLLSGEGNEEGAFVAGTGFNMGLVRKEGKKKILVNLEYGNFNKFTPSAVLQKIDDASEQPGEQLLEKAISGKYLALYFNEKITERKLPISPISTSQELSELSHTNHTDVAGDLARAIIERSAFLVGAALAGIYNFYQQPSTLRLIGEGSLLWEGWHYRENIQKQLEVLGIPPGTVTIKHIPDSSMKGAIGLVTK